MQKVFATRLEEAVINEMERVTRKKGISKRQFLEQAICQYAKSLSTEDQSDIWSETQGAWRRREGPEITARQARRHFQHAMERHHRKRNARLR